MPLDLKTISHVMMAAILVAVLYWFRRNLRPRGPRPPVHPLPADDARLLRGKRASR